MYKTTNVHGKRAIGGYTAVTFLRAIGGRPTSYDPVSVCVCLSQVGVLSKWHLSSTKADARYDKLAPVDGQNNLTVLATVDV